MKNRSKKYSASRGAALSIVCAALAGCAPAPVRELDALPVREPEAPLTVDVPKICVTPIVPCFETFCVERGECEVAEPPSAPSALSEEWKARVRARPPCDPLGVPSCTSYGPEWLPFFLPPSSSSPWWW
jgi:hypothetical protein